MSAAAKANPADVHGTSSCRQEAQKPCGCGGRPPAAGWGWLPLKVLPGPRRGPALVFASPNFSIRHSF